MTSAPLLIPTDVSVELTLDDPPVQIKLSNAAIEINVHCTEEEVDAFPKVVNAFWEQRASLQIGQCLGNPAFWCISEDRQSINLLISEDDEETWQVAVVYPVSVLDAIVSEIAAELAERED